MSYCLNLGNSKDNKAYGGHGYGAGGGAGGLYSISIIKTGLVDFYGGGNGADGFVYSYIEWD